MLKRILAFLMCAVTVFTAGCAAVIEGDYSHSSDHEQSYVHNGTESEKTVEVKSRQALYETIKSFINEGIEYGAVQFKSYQGDMEKDLSEVCIAAANDTPLGSYAVYYINYSLNKIVSYYEANISVIYKKTPEELAQIKKISSREEFTKYLSDAMKNREESVTFFLENTQIPVDTVNTILDQIYYSDPGNVLYFPKCTVKTYPEESYNYIIEVTMAFPYTQDTAERRITELNARKEEGVAAINGRTISEKVQTLSVWLRESVEFDEARANSENYSRWYNSYTAYGALVLGKAVGEGYAMAMKLICDEVGIECEVIRGRLNNMTHAWNIVKLDDGNYYHIDSSKISEDGQVFFNDAQMQDRYWWDTASYRECPGGEFSPDPEPAEPPEGGETVVTDPVTGEITDISDETGVLDEPEEAPEQPDAHSTEEGAGPEN